MKKFIALFLTIIVILTVFKTLDLLKKRPLNYQETKGFLMPLKKDLLKKYKEKRDFSKTPEPKAIVIPKDKQKRIFTIQEHHATHLHWDFRLEIEGVMPSWAIPKGPSLDPKVKRLAVQTEDHPVAYAQFEGVIPEGYGAGTVMVWDYGTYKNVREKDGKLVPMEKCLKEGRIEVELQGKKLKGVFVLIRFKDEEKNWLFFKKDDEFADARRNITKTENKSALTDRTIKQIKEN
ncbi:MAG: hypothetical protein US13_C0002G0074 [candidate division TM6 bacterium GW2011_GWE2_36_25]|nr:MAG: hypothetical protein US03_C0002G0074 [candidate division TM6 bacterium GW2011_GWF2_36_131]KKQ03508.1 MAG: hypothetical protein US13_C0002G0074 [candidate division TM6 bacterium GW2011_GWE2_36_25]KKQ20218.1 MAG: hypothetical protein US32_C0001G0115 [candidate division TM6 bacterium GW2011_GWA2_36_9]